MIKLLPCLLILLAAACDKSENQPREDCREEVIRRLELSAEIPDVLCPNRVTLFEVDGTFYYLVVNIGPSCNSVDLLYDCAGELVCIPEYGEDCFDRDWPHSGQGELLGYF